MSKRILIPRLAVASIVVCFLAAYQWKPGGVRGLEIISDVTCLLAAALAAVLAGVASSRFDRGALQRRAWGLLALGMALWTVAEALWMVFDFVSGEEVPYPSVADIVWAVGYVPLILGVCLGYRGLGVPSRPTRWALVILAYAALLAGLAYWLIRPMFTGPDAAEPAESFLGSYYLIGNLTLAFLATLLLVVAWGGLIGRPWLPITLGMLLFAISDSAFAYIVWKDLYVLGGNWQTALIDAAYVAAYLLVALGAYEQATLRLSDMTRSS